MMMDKRGKLRIASSATICIICFLIALLAHSAVAPSSPMNYTIIGNSVEWENAYGMMTVTPHTITSLSDGCFEVDATSYISTQDIDCAVAGNSGKLVGKSASIWMNYSHDVSETYLENDTISYTCPYSNFSYTISPKYAWCYDANGTILFEHSFEGGDVFSGTIWWRELRNHTRMVQSPAHFDWFNINDKFGKQTISGKDYYIISNVSWVQNTSKKVKLCFDANMQKTANGWGVDEKLDIFCKRSSDTIQSALSNGNMFIVDPWANASYENSFSLTLTNNDPNNIWLKYSTFSFSIDTAGNISAGNLDANCAGLSLFCNEQEMSIALWNDTFFGTGNGCNDANTTIFSWLNQNISSSSSNSTDCIVYMDKDGSRGSYKKNVSEIGLIYRKESIAHSGYAVNISTPISIGDLEGFELVYNITIPTASAYGNGVHLLGVNGSVSIFQNGYGGSAGQCYMGFASQGLDFSASNPSVWVKRHLITEATGERYKIVATFYPISNTYIDGTIYKSDGTTAVMEQLGFPVNNTAPSITSFKGLTFSPNSNGENHGENLTNIFMKRIINVEPSVIVGAMEGSNTAPTTPSPILSPSTAYTNTDMNCSSIISDPEADAMTVYFNLTVDNSFVSQTTLASQASGSQPSWIISEGNYTKGQNVSCWMTLNDGTVNSATNTTSIDISNSNPLIVQISDILVSEDFSSYSWNLANNISDADTTDANLIKMYYLNDSTIFTVSINNATNGITFLPILNMFGSVQVTLNVTDDEGLWNSTSFMFTVNATNDMPQFVDILNFDLNEDFGSYIINVTANISDIETALADLTLSYSLNDSSIFGISVNDITHTATLTSISNMYGSVEVNLGVWDEGGLVNGSTFMVTVGSVNDNPLFQPITSFNKNEDFGTFGIIASANISDVETADANLEISYSVNASGIFTISIINATNTITFTSLMNQYGSREVTLTLFDEDGSTNATTFMLTVDSINDNVLFNEISDVSKNEDFASFNVQLQAYIEDIEDVDGLINVSWSMNSSGLITLSMNNITKNLTVASVLNQFGSVDIILTDFDSEGSSNSTTFTVTVASVNDNPLFQPISDFNASEEFVSFTLNLTNNISDIEDATSLLNISYTMNDSTMLAVSIDNATKEITFTSIVDKFGSVQINLTIFDTGGLINATSFILTLWDVPEPVIASQPSGSGSGGSGSGDLTKFALSIDTQRIWIQNNSNEITISLIEVTSRIVRMINNINISFSPSMPYDTISQRFNGTATSTMISPKTTGNFTMTITIKSAGIRDISQSYNINVINSSEARDMNLESVNGRAVPIASSLGDMSGITGNAVRGIKGFFDFKENPSSIYYLLIGGIILLATAMVLKKRRKNRLKGKM